LQLPFCNFVGEELTVFGCVKEEYEKTLRITGLALPRNLIAYSWSLYRAL